LIDDGEDLFWPSRGGVFAVNFDRSSLVSHENVETRQVKVPCGIDCNVILVPEVSLASPAVELPFLDDEVVILVTEKFETLPLTQASSMG
jgi:hypothetical protein